MKKRLAVFVIVVMVLGLASCAILQKAQEVFCGPSLAEQEEAKAGAAFLESALKLMANLGMSWADPTAKKIFAGLATFENIQAGLCVTLVALNAAIQAVDEAGSLGQIKGLRAAVVTPGVPKLDRLRLVGRR